MWQFFGVFGFKGLFGLLMIAFLFVALGLVIVHIGNALSTGDLIIGIIAAAFLFMAYFAMLAAGGALIEAQFGVPRVAGSTVLMFLVVLTTVKGFGTVSARQGKVVPILLAATLSMALIILFREFGSIEGKPAAGASPLAPNWIIAAVVFVSYNMMGAIPILGSCTVYAEDLRIVKRGAALGGSFLGTCALILYLVTLTDPILSSKAICRCWLSHNCWFLRRERFIPSYCSYPFSGQLQAVSTVTAQNCRKMIGRPGWCGHPLWQDWQSL